MTVNWVLILGGAVLILIEVVLGAAMGFDFLLIGSALLLGGVLGLFLHSSAIGFAAAGVLALVYVFCRPRGPARPASSPRERPAQPTAEIDRRRP